MPGSDPRSPALSACYDGAAFASAQQMRRERSKRRATQGLPALIPLGGPYDNGDYGCGKRGESAAFLALCKSYWDSEDAWWYGWNAAAWGLDWGVPPLPGSYEGDYNLSRRQFITDDEAERTGRPFTLLKSPDGISPFSPSRLAQVALEDNFSALRAQEEEAVRLLAQTLTPSQVAAISSSQSTTDPIGRLLLGVLAQNAAHTAELSGVALSGPTIGAPAVSLIGPTNLRPALSASTILPAPPMGASSGTDAAKLGVVPAMTPPANLAGIVENAGGGSPVLFWALAIGGLIFSLATGKRKVEVF